jgi:predicted RNase H-like nuclease (RuvC/YqgF family)
VNAERAIESIKKQNTFLEREIGILETRLADYRHRADQRGILTYNFVGLASSNLKTKSLERRIAQLTTHLERNNVRISKLQESLLGSLGQVRHQFGFITTPHTPSAKELAEDAREADLERRYQEIMRGKK